MNPSSRNSLRVGCLHLATPNFTEQVRFYTFSLGLKVISQEEVIIRLGAGTEPLISLEWDPAAFHEEGTTGLYHVAIRLPSRLELARVVAHLAETGSDFVGVADHGVSESFYLTDYDGNGLELYADRPATDWPRDSLGGLKMGTDPLDIDNLIGEIGAETPAWAGIAAGADIGHVHLTVNDLKGAVDFYTKAIGLEETQRLPSGAVFLSCDGYHHQVAVNNWLGENAPARTEGAQGMRWFELILAEGTALEGVRVRVKDAGGECEERSGGLLLHDPAGNGVLVKGGD
jgi:catechol 2,3-dioxygenase